MGNSCKHVGTHKNHLKKLLEQITVFFQCGGGAWCGGCPQPLMFAVVKHRQVSEASGCVTNLVV